MLIQLALPKMNQQDRSVKLQVYYMYNITDCLQSSIHQSIKSDEDESLPPESSAIIESILLSPL